MDSSRPVRLHMGSHCESIIVWPRVVGRKESRASLHPAATYRRVGTNHQLISLVVDKVPRYLVQAARWGHSAGIGRSRLVPAFDLFL